MVFVEFLQFTQNYLLYRLYIVPIQVRLKYLLLQAAQFIISQFPVQVLVQYSENSHYCLLELGSQLLAGQIVQWR